jgi:hypothetical protein
LLCVLVAAVLCAAAVPRASGQARFSADVGLGEGFGVAAYDLQVASGGDLLKSRLEFPLDGLEASLRLMLSLPQRSRDLWRFEAGVSAGITDPGGLMRDYDWIKPVGYPPVPFSYTESNVRATAVGAYVQASRTLSVAGPLEPYVVFGYAYQYLYQSVRGYTGWQYLFDTSGNPYDVQTISSTAEALRYTLNAHTLPLGLGLRFELGPRWQLALEAAFLGVYASDVDDHLLRYKISTAAGLGYGGAGRLEALWLLSERKAGPVPYLALNVEGLAWRVPTTQTQRWYDDEPSTPLDETGMAT